MRSIYLVALVALSLGLSSCKSDTKDNNSTDDNSAINGDTEGIYVDLAPSGQILDKMLGIASHIDVNIEESTERNFEIEKLAEAGVGILRTGFKWDRIEREDDVFTPEGYDVMVGMAAEADIDVLMTIDYGVGWAQPGGTDDEIDPEKYGDYAGYLASHFGGQLRYYEIWNEQNIARFWEPQPNPEHYGLLLKNASQKIRANDADAFVVFGGISSYDDLISAEYPMWSYFHRVYEAHPDICDYIDGLGIHPYTFAQYDMPEISEDFESWIWPDFGTMVDQARDLLEEAGCRDREIWMTELGWPDYAIGLDRQAAYLVRSLLISMWKGVDKWFWYTFWDDEPDSFPPTEDYFGFFTWPNDDPEVKPCYEGLKAAHEIWGRMQFAANLTDSLTLPENVYAMVFADEQGGVMIAAWLATESLTDQIAIDIPLPPEANGYEVIDMFGTQLDDVDGGTTAEVTVGYQPVYILTK